MEVFINGDRPKVLSAGTYVAAFVLHALLFGLLYLFGELDFSPKETVIPIDLTVVVDENLEGEEDEPPPPPEPEPPPPEPEPEPEPPPLPPREDPKPPDAVKQQPAETNKVAEAKPPEQPKPQEPPKKTAQELREERIRRIRDSGVVKNAQPAPPTNGRTERRPPNWKELLNAGYRPGPATTVAADEKQRCISIIKREFYEKWDKVGRPPWSDTLREMRLRVTFGPNGKVIGYTLVQSSGDAAADATVTRAAALVRYVNGLSTGFIESCQKDPVVVRFKVTPK